MTSISSLTLTSVLRQSIQQSQVSLAQAQSEISTGRQADLGLALGAGTGKSLSLKAEVDRLAAFTNVNSVATTRLATTADTLTALVSSAQSISSALITAATAGGSTTSLQTIAKSALQNTIAGLNTSVGGQFVFGGINTDVTPLGDYFSASPSAAKQAVDSSFQTAFGVSQSDSGASSISGPAMQSYLDNQFAGLFSSSSWSGTWSSASSQTIGSSVAPGQRATTSVSANDQAFRQLAEAYTMVSEFSGQNLSDDARAAVVSSAQKLVSAGLDGLTQTQSSVGLAQATIATADSRNSAQSTVLKSSIGELDDVDPYTLSSQVTTLQTQLEASYSLTSRLQQLSLVNYLNR